MVEGKQYLLSDERMGHMILSEFREGAPFELEWSGEMCWRS